MQGLRGWVGANPYVSGRAMRGKLVVCEMKEIEAWSRGCDGEGTDRGAISDVG